MRVHIARVWLQGRSALHRFRAAGARARRRNGLPQVEGLEARRLLSLSVPINSFGFRAGGDQPSAITAGPDGNVWFADGAGFVGQINLTTHVISEFTTPTFQSAPAGIAAGPDGNLWFTESQIEVNNIGKINPTTHAFAEFPIPTAQSRPDGITAGPDGNLWFTENAASKIGKINPTTGAITEFATPTANSQPDGIAAGPDGNLWFTELGGNKIAKISPTTGTFTEFAVPTAGSGPQGITAGPDGNLWFTEKSGNNVGRITPSGTITEFAIPTANSEPDGITTGPDGNLYFAENFKNKIGRITTAGSITELATPTFTNNPAGITTGPDHNLWFTAPGSPQIGQLNPTTQAFAVFPLSGGARTEDITSGPDGNLWFADLASNVGEINPTTHSVIEFPTPTANTDPTEITTGPDGNLWFTEAGRGAIGQINVTTHVITEFPLPTASSSPDGIVTGPDGNLWFTEINGEKIGQINPTTHAIAEFPLPTAGGKPFEITAGHDGNLWFTENAASKIGRITPAGVITEFPTPTANSSPYDIVTDLGHLWFTETNGNNIGEFDPANPSVINEFPLPAGDHGPAGLTPGSDGNIWFVASALSEINPDTHAFGVFTAAGSPEIASGPDGNLWMTSTGGGVFQAVLSDLALAGTAPATANLGSHVTYTLTVTNTDTKNLTGVTVTDTLPSGVTFVSATGGVTPVNGVLTFALGSLASGASTAVTIVVTVPAAGTFTDSATASFGQTDPTPSDNSVTLTTKVSAPAGPDLALSGSAPSSARVGSNLTYSLTVANNGTAGATGVTLSDTLPTGVTFFSATGGVTPVSGVLTFNIGSLAAGASTNITIVVIPTAAGTLTDSASASMSQTDPTPADDSITLTTTVSALTGPDLALSGTAPSSGTVGTNVTYSLTVTNNGSAGATGVTLTDTLPSGVTFVSATDGVTPVSGVLTFNLGDLAAAANTAVTIVVTPTVAGTLTDSATASMNQTDPTPGDNSVTKTTMVTPPVGVDGPTVTSVQRFGFHAMPTTLVVTFDELLDPARAQDLANYQIVALGGFRRTIGIKSAVYDSATQTVTLSPAQRLNLHHRFRLTVVGTAPDGVTDTSENLLDGQKTGQPGSNFVTIVSAANLVLTTTDPPISRKLRKIEYKPASHLGTTPHDRGVVLFARSPS